MKKHYKKEKPCEDMEKDEEMMMMQMHNNMMLAHAYVPWQFYERTYCPSEALMKGTLFPELYGVYTVPS